MALASRISYTAAAAGLKAIVDLLDEDGDPGYVEIRTGTPPATVESAATGDVLVVLPLAQPAFNAPTDQNPGARVTADVISPVNATASGAAGWYRAYDGAGNAVTQGSCGTSDANMIMPTTTIADGQPVQIISWTIDMPEN